jgi:pimeloyl-ACP methyl ester carboxylesterase
LSHPKPAVILVHGWNGNPGNWGLVAQRLRLDGWTVYTPRLSFKPWRATIEHDARLLANYIDTTALTTRPMVLVGYSRGGLVIRAYQQNHSPGNLVGVVYIGVPHYGCPVSTISLFRPFGGLSEMAANSGLIERLNANLYSLRECPHLAICGRATTLGGYSDLIVPEESATMNGLLTNVSIDLMPSTDAWHGNLIRPWWAPIPLPGVTPRDTVWPVTAGHISRFLTDL